MVQATSASAASLRRAAILLESLDPQARQRLLQQLPPVEAAQLRRALGQLADVDPLERRRAMSVFCERIGSAAVTSAAAAGARSSASGRAASDREPRASGAAPGSEDFPNAAASASPTPDGTPRDDGERTDATRRLNFLGDVPDAALLRAVAAEHPQTLAVVLASISPAQAARLLPRLDASMRTDALRRLGRLEQIAPEALAEIESHLRHTLGESARQVETQGRRCLAAIMVAMQQEDPQGQADPGDIMKQMMAGDPSLSALVQQQRREASAGPHPRGTFEQEAGSGAGMRDEGTRDDRAASDRPDAPYAHTGYAHTGHAHSGYADGATHSDGTTIEIRRRTAPGAPTASDRAATADSGDRGERAKPGTAADRAWRHAGMAPDQPSELDADEVDRRLESLSTETLRQVLAGLEARQALLTLCGLRDATAQRLIRSLPRRQGKAVRRGLDSLGSLQLWEIDRAKSLAAAEAVRLQASAAAEASGARSAPPALSRAA